jgi:hypothetical protein
MLSGFQLTLLALDHLRTLRQFPLATAILVPLHHTGQIRLGEPLQRLRQTPGRLLQVSKAQTLAVSAPWPFWRRVARVRLSLISLASGGSAASMSPAESANRRFDW